MSSAKTDPFHQAQNKPTMKSFAAAALGALLACTHHAAAFSPAARTKALNNLKEMRMTGAGGAASPDTNYVDGELCVGCNVEPPAR